MSGAEKRCFTAEGGYILLYVMVVILTLCILAASICTSAVRNLKVQQASAEHMEFVYEAEGVVERFVAELIRAVETSDRVVDSSVAEADAQYEAMLEDLFQSAVVTAKDNALADRKLVGDVMNSLEDLTIEYDDTMNLGTCLMDLRVVIGDSAVETKIQWKMIVTRDSVTDELGGISDYRYHIHQIVYEYMSYTVETVEIVDLPDYVPEEGEV